MEHIEYDRMSVAENSHWWYVGLHELILHYARMERTRRGPLSILDAGCGTGRLCQLMNGLGDVDGCDISDRALELSKKRGIKAFRADLNTLDVPPNSYDLITSIDVLYHKWVSDDRAVLSRFYNALKPRGLLILNLPAFTFLRGKHDSVVHSRERYTKAPMKEKLEALGFMVERTTYRVFPLFPLIAACRLSQRLRAPREEDRGASDVWLPGRAVNSAFLALTRLENHVIRSLCSVPFGTSLFVLARRPGQ